MLEDSSCDDIVCWGEDQQSFVIWCAHPFLVITVPMCDGKTSTNPGETEPGNHKLWVYHERH